MKHQDLQTTNNLREGHSFGEIGKNISKICVHSAAPPKPKPKPLPNPHHAGLSRFQEQARAGDGAEDAAPKGGDLGIDLARVVEGAEGDMAASAGGQLADVIPVV